MAAYKNYIYGDQNIQIPAHLNFGKYVLDFLRKKNDDDIAFVNAVTKENLTYKDVTQYSVDLAVALQKLGVQKGDTVAVGTEQRITMMPTFIGILYTGAAYTPYELESGRAVLQHKLEIAQPKYMLCSKKFWDVYKDIVEKCHSIKFILNLDDDGIKDATPISSLLTVHTDPFCFEPAAVQGQVDTVMVLYSSGTTGMPKGVQLTHLNCILNSLPDDFKDESLKNVYILGSWFHNYDNFMSYKFLALGRKLVFVPNMITPQAVLKAIKDYNVDIAMLVPSVIGLISKLDNIEEYKIESLKIIYSRSSPLRDGVIKLMQERIPSLKLFLQGYGMTEAGEPSSESWGNIGPKSGSVGKASPGITLKVSDPITNETLGANQKGEIRVRGPVLMKGYIGVDPSTYLDDEGFLKTGDLGYYDEDHYVFIVDRLKDIMNVAGFKVAPMEVEAILQMHPGVKEVGVVGKPDPICIDLPAAFIVRQPNTAVTEEELHDFLSKQALPCMQLKGGIKFLTELPRNSRGKVLRNELRKMLIN